VTEHTSSARNAAQDLISSKFTALVRKTNHRNDLGSSKNSMGSDFETALFDS